jgi:hypothetical protein
MWSAILHDAREGHPALVTFAFVCVACAVATGIPLLVDSRLVNGAPVWHKPLKFFVSVAIYSFTFAWYLGQDPDRERQRRRGGLAWWLGTGIWVALAIELALIAVQAFRGVGSHFNVSTRFDAGVFNLMGLMIFALTLIHTALWVRLLRARWTNRPRLAACRWGAGLAMVGLCVGALMVRPRPDQLADARAGRPVLSGAHTVGGPDGGAGLPFVNWSTEAGDRRVGHFVGLHAMQAVPAVALLAPARWPQPAVIAAVRATGLAYGALTVLLIMQAQQARPVLRPGTTLGVAALLAALGWIVSMMVIASRGASRSGNRPPVVRGGKPTARA